MINVIKTGGERGLSSGLKLFKLLQFYNLKVWLYTVLHTMDEIGITSHLSSYYTGNY